MARDDFDEEYEEGDPSGRSYRVDLSHWLYFFLPEEDRARDEQWMTRGKCFKKTELNEVFNPPLDEDSETGESKTARIITIAAKKHCNDDVDGWRCPVRKECLDYAIENRIHFGVWGGCTVRERRRISAERNRKKAKKKRG